MSQRVESHVFPAIVGLIGVAAFMVLIYLLLSFGIGVIDRLFNGPSSGIPIMTELIQVFKTSLSH